MADYILLDLLRLCHFTKVIPERKMIGPVRGGAVSAGGLKKEKYFSNLI